MINVKEKEQFVNQVKESKNRLGKLRDKEQWLDLIVSLYHIAPYFYVGLLLIVFLLGIAAKLLLGKQVIIIATKIESLFNSLQIVISVANICAAYFIWFRK